MEKKITKAYFAKEKKEKPLSKMTAKEKAKEKKETPIHEKAEHAKTLAGGNKILKQWNKALNRKKK